MQATTAEERLILRYMKKWKNRLGLRGFVVAWKMAETDAERKKLFSYNADAVTEPAVEEQSAQVLFRSGIWDDKKSCERIVIHELLHVRFHAIAQILDLMNGQLADSLSPVQMRMIERAIRDVEEGFVRTAADLMMEAEEWS